MSGKKWYNLIKNMLAKTNYDNPPLTRLIESLLEQGFSEGASDIYFEPNTNQMDVSYRIDGDLNNILTLPAKTGIDLISQIKNLSQNGRLELNTPKNKIIFSVCLIYTNFGEKIIMRPDNQREVGLEKISLSLDLLKLIEKNIKESPGMILVAGPAGSGKTTLLYKILELLDSPHINISTIEDRIKHPLENINQSRLNPKIGYTAAVALRSLLRQDPNIIMADEINNEEAMKVALQNSAKGRAFLSGLRSSGDVVNIISDLIKTGMPPELISSAINLIITQRLVRRPCGDCLEKYNPDAEEKEMLNQIIKNNISSQMPFMEKLSFYRGRGCGKCHGTGYRGQTSLYETTKMSPELIESVQKNDGQKKIAELIKDGLNKASRGETTLAEIFRLAKE